MADTAQAGLEHGAADVTELASDTTLPADLRAAIRKGATVDETTKTAGEAERPKWQLFDDYHRRNATAGFAELEWETP